MNIQKYNIFAPFFIKKEEHEGKDAMINFEILKSNEYKYIIVGKLYTVEDKIRFYKIFLILIYLCSVFKFSCEIDHTLRNYYSS